MAAYRASGLKGNSWTDVNGMPLRARSSWCAHAQRWRALLDGVSVSESAPKVAGFVAARVAGATAATVRIDLHAGSTRIELHWLVANAHDLAAWLRRVGR